MKHLLTTLAAASLLSSASSAATIWFNELHYDNAGGDVGEFVEIIVDTSAHTAADLTLSLYNGSDDELYGNGADTFNVATDFTLGDAIAGTTLQIYYITFPANGLQNGGPDGMSLSSSAGGGSVEAFISYEGGSPVGPAGDGPAVGLTAIDIGVSESSGTAIGDSLGLVGNGAMGAEAGGDFTWAVTGDDTPGSLNIGQTIPEPGSFALIAIAGALGIIRRRR